MAPKRGTKRKAESESEEDSSSAEEEPPKKKARTESPKSKAKAPAGGMAAKGNILKITTECLQRTDWWGSVKTFVELPSYKACCAKVQKDIDAKGGPPIYPPCELVMNAFSLTSMKKIKVVIFGQDPYMNAGEGMGLSFSVPKGVKIPPSLRRMYKLLESNQKGFKTPSHGDLTEWADQGVFMLNATLTVQEKKANSHAKYGWMTFTDNVISLISRETTGVVFLFWGKFAQKKEGLVNKKKHAVINDPHPSPLSGAGWLSCNSFTKCNAALTKLGKEPVDWRITG